MTVPSTRQSHVTNRYLGWFPLPPTILAISVGSRVAILSPNGPLWSAVTIPEQGEGNRKKNCCTGIIQDYCTFCLPAFLATHARTHTLRRQEQNLASRTSPYGYAYTSNKQTNGPSWQWRIYHPREFHCASWVNEASLAKIFIDAACSWLHLFISSAFPVAGTRDVTNSSQPNCLSIFIQINEITRCPREWNFRSNLISLTSELRNPYFHRPFLWFLLLSTFYKYAGNT